MYMQTSKLSYRSKRLFIIGHYLVYGVRSCQRVIALYLLRPFCQASTEYENKTKHKIKYSH